jgi:hypothetical protein
MKKFILQEFKSKYPNKKVFIISSATKEWIEELIDYLIDNYTTNIEEDRLDNENNADLIVFDLKNKVDPKKIIVEYLWDMKFKASWERLEQIVRMTDFDNKEAVLRVYDVLDKMWVIRLIEPELEKITNQNQIDNSFFFEWNEQANDFSPILLIAWKNIPLDKLRYNL